MAEKNNSDGDSTETGEEGGEGNTNATGVVHLHGLVCFCLFHPQKV